MASFGNSRAAGTLVGYVYITVLSGSGMKAEKSDVGASTRITDGVRNRFRTALSRPRRVLSSHYYRIRLM